MDLSAIYNISKITGTDIQDVSSASLVSSLYNDKKADGNVFEAMLNSAINNISTTNSYLSDAEDEEIKFALGQTENTHDLTIALQKASTALQYTVAVRDKLIAAYKEIMQIQI